MPNITDSSTPRHQLDTGARLIEAARALFEAGVMSHSGHANLSARLDDNRFLLTTTGTIRGLRADQLGVVALNGEHVAGEFAPDRAEIVDMHAVLYRARPEIGCVIHTHSPAVTAFALANQPLPARTEALVRLGQVDPIPLVAWGPRGSGASIRGIEAALAAQPSAIAVLLANHGLLAFGADPVSGVDVAVALEESAQAEIAAAALGGGVDLPDDALTLVRAAMVRVRA